ASGATISPYLLGLRSEGAGSAAPPASPGLVASLGHGSDGKRTGVRLRLHRPAWLVLGEGYSSGWRAACRSRGGQERPLGSPKPIDGFANGWRVAGSCA